MFHLGNVLTVVSDRKIAVDNNNDNTVDYFLPDIVSSTDYYAFGSPMPGRHFQSGSKYRYSFNGKEQDDETVSTGGGTQDYGMRIYNPNLGKFLSVDPLARKYPELTPYQFASNTPIQAIDLDGLEAFFINGTSNFDIMRENISMPYFQFQNNAMTKGVALLFGNKTNDLNFTWSGNNSDAARKLGGIQLAAHILKNRKPGEPITLVGHSHGGNVAIEAINYLVTNKLVNASDINLVTLNTPDQEEQTLPENSDVNFYSVNAYGDFVQNNLGSSSFDNNGVLPDNYDKEIMYEDQNKDLLLDLSNHAQTLKNFYEWFPKLNEAKKELDSSKKPNQEPDTRSVPSYRDTP